MDNPIPPFVYEKYKCLECGISISPNQIFCTEHRQVNPVKPFEKHKAGKKEKSEKKPVSNQNKETKVSDMRENQIGYVEEGALYEHRQQLNILGSASCTKKPEPYKTVKIRYRKGLYEVDRNSIDLMDICIGIPDMEGDIISFKAKLVSDFR